MIYLVLTLHGLTALLSLVNASREEDDARRFGYILGAGMWGSTAVWLWGSR
jgi:hypothetical protein